MPLLMASAGSEIAGAAADPVFTAEFLTAGLVVLADDIISSAHLQGSTQYEIGGDFFSRIRIHALYCRAGHVHLLGALFLGHPHVVDETDGLVFFDGHDLNFFGIRMIFTVKEIVFRKIANALALFRSCHIVSSFPVNSFISDISRYSSIGSREHFL